ncbi:MAG: protein phosphatase 2C domain-containing protein [Vicinamibacterales bacterium]
MLRAFGVTDRGRVRPTNEDCFGIDPDLQLCVIADGMGGHNAGEVASRLAVEAVLDYVANNSVTTTWPHGYDSGLSERANLLKTAVQVANTRVFEAAAASSEYTGMGTTIVALLVGREVMTVAHVGDSRLYALSSGSAEQLTADDSWAAVMLARDPSLDPDILKTHPMRNALTSVIGAKSQVDVHVGERALAPDDLILMTTDGVHGVLSEATLAETCAATADLQELAGRLVREAMDTGSRDNCTALVARYEVE